MRSMTEPEARKLLDAAAGRLRELATRARLRLFAGESTDAILGAELGEATCSYAEALSAWERASAASA